MLKEYNDKESTTSREVWINIYCGIRNNIYLSNTIYIYEPQAKGNVVLHSYLKQFHFDQKLKSSNFIFQKILQIERFNINTALLLSTHLH